MNMEDDGEDKDDAKRRTRNLSEKKRRDQFNTLINELSLMVTTNNRKMDKSTVLKSTISFLRNHKEVTVRSRAHDVQKDWKPSFLSNEEFKYLVLESLEGFVMVMSTSGRIHYVSESITTLLDHNASYVLNKNIFDIIYEEDYQSLYNILQSGASLDPMQVVNNKNEIRFQCHLRRARGLIDDTKYELVQFNGHFRPNIEQTDSEDPSPYQQDDDSRILFVCTGRLYTPQLIKDVYLVDTSQNEFTSRHSLEWKFLFLDHRAPPIIGYLPFEVLGTSGYDYYHFDDLEKVVNCHEALMQKGELTSCYYRFLTKGQQWIWLQTRFYISYHQWNSKPEFVVCTHRVVSYADIAKSMKQESADVEIVSELENNQEMKEDPPEETSTTSTQYIPDRTYRNTYRNASQTLPRVVKLPSATSSTVGTVDTTGSNATAHSWPRSQPRYAAGSDSASLSGDSRSSQRNSSRDRCEGAMSSQIRKGSEMGAVCVEPAPYVSVPVTTVLPLPMHPLPVIVSSDQTQLQMPRQEQLQRKHEELQQMIVQQQEELRQVKEQLLLARLGILQPFINVQNLYVSQEEVQQGQRVQTQNAAYEGAAPRPPVQYYPQTPSEHNPHNNAAE